MITKRLLLPGLGNGVGLEFGFDTKGWWINHVDGTGKVRTYILFGTVRHLSTDGVVWSIHLLWLKLSIAFLKEAK